MEDHTGDIWLAYKDREGNEHHQHWRDVVECGTLIDPETGDDMEIIGLVTAPKSNQDFYVSCTLGIFHVENEKEALEYALKLFKGGMPTLQENALKVSRDMPKDF